MTDRELIKLCADAMGITVQLLAPETGFPSCDRYVIPRRDEGENPTYDPLRDDADAMALIKKFDMVVERDDPFRRIGATRECWGVTIFVARPKHRGADTYVVRKSPNLNRAICECVAKMQAAHCGDIGGSPE